MGVIFLIIEDEHVKNVKKCGKTVMRQLEFMPH